MKKTLATCAFAGTALALGMSMPVGHAAETPTPAPTFDNEAYCADLDMLTRDDGTCYMEGYENTGTYMPTAPGQPDTRPYCADGVTVAPADDSCVVYVAPVEAGLIETPPIIDTLAPEAVLTPATTYVELDPIMEDEPGWDCRTMGNQVCGVDIMGTWYLVQFIDGMPSTVTAR